MLGCSGFGLFDVSTRVMVPELEKLGPYLPPSTEKIFVPVHMHRDSSDLVELSTIATQLFKATYSVLKFILKKVRKILLEASPDLSTAPQKRGVETEDGPPQLSKKARAWHDDEIQEKDEEIQAHEEIQAQKDEEIAGLNTKIKELELKVSSLESAAGPGRGRSRGGGSAAGGTAEIEERCKQAFAKLTMAPLKLALGAVYGSTNGSVAALRDELVSAIMSGGQVS